MITSNTDRNNKCQYFGTFSSNLHIKCSDKFLIITSAFLCIFQKIENQIYFYIA